MRFNFTGTIKANPVDSTKGVPFYKTGKTEGGNDYLVLNLAVSEGSNRAFVEMFGMERDVIKTKNVDGDNIEIDWEDRNDSDAIKDVANYRKFVLSLDEDRSEYITELDFIKRVAIDISEINGKRFTITGSTRKNFYKGNVSDRFQIQNIYEAADDRKDKLETRDTIYYTKDSVDTSEWKDNKKIIFNCYTREYLSANDTGADKGGYYYVEQTYVLDCRKVKFDNEGHVNAMKFRLNMLGLDYEDGKIVNKIKPKKVISQMITGRYICGAEEIDFDESQLTAIQKQKIELGLATLDDFRPRESIYGERIVEYRISDIPCKGDFSDGPVYLDEKISEFEEEIFTFSEDEVIEKSDDDASEPEEDDEVDIDDLF